MAAASKNEHPEPVDDAEAVEEAGVAGPLVPFAGALAVTPGVQAFRRGDVILYTVRGEPRQVLELMGHLQQEKVGEVVALISHQAPLEDDEDEDDVGEAVEAGDDPD
jgi:hypothetical protein